MTIKGLKMKRLWILGLLASCVIAAGQGFNAPTFSYFDTDGDGKITKSELEDGRKTRHNEMAKEGKMLRNAANAPAFSVLDTNGDGVISKKEFAAHQEAMRTK